MKDKQIETHELMEVVTPQVPPRSVPVEVYESAIKKRKWKQRAGLGVLLSLEVLGAAFFGLQIKENRLASRMLKEYEIRTTGQLVTATGIYEGETDFGAFVGEGTFQSSTGAVYQGSWKNNSLEGLGSIQVPSVGTYTGDFLNSEKSGFGTFVWDDGAVYEGEWRNDAMDGQGSYTSPNGVSYVGTFRENVFSDGVCTFANETGSYSLLYVDKEINTAAIQYADGATYTGSCGETTLEGSGVMNYPNGDSYSGSYSNGQRNGHGIYTWSFGDTYDGEWVNDTIEGLGTYTFASGNCYSGTFAEGAIYSGTYHVVNNFGDYTFTVNDGVPVAVEMTLYDGSTYSGDMSSDGELTGTAQIQYSNGDRYDGKVLNGSKSGQGYYVWSSGAKYDGLWENDRMDGQGTYWYPESEKGFKITGSFSRGVPSGECYYYPDSSTKYKTDWSNGKCVKIYE